MARVPSGRLRLRQVGDSAFVYVGEARSRYRVDYGKTAGWIAYLSLFTAGVLWLVGRYWT